MESWEEIVEDILKSEGGLTRDHAGLTNFGIVAGQYSGLTEDEVENLTRDQAKEWYTKHFYSKLKRIPRHLLHIVIDFAVNGGISRSIKTLQKAANYFHQANIDEDGLIGPNTLRWAERVSAGEFRQLRFQFYEELVEKNPEKYARFRTGWLRRCMRV